MGIISLIIAISLVVGFIGCLGDTDLHVALVKTDGWQTTGDFPKLSLKPVTLQIPDKYVKDPEFTLWRNWKPEGSTMGVLTSAPFQAPEFVAIPYAAGGMRGRDQANELFIRCMVSGEKISVSTAETFDSWIVVYRKIPDGFCNSMVQLVGIGHPSAIGEYLGVGTPFAVSSSEYYGHSGFGAKGAVVLSTWFIFSMIGIACCCIGTSSKMRSDPLAFALVGIGASGMVTFAGEAISPLVGQSVAVGVSVASLLLVAIFAWKRTQELRAIISQISLPLFCWLMVALAYTAMASAADNGGGPWAANALFSPLSWSVDNQNPLTFTEQFMTRSPDDPVIAGNWLFADRTPLLTVLLIIPRTLVIGPLSQVFDTDFLYIGDSMAAVTLLSIWSAIIVSFLDRISIRRPYLFVAIVSASPFVLFNSIYTWGKLLGAAYVLLAFAIMLTRETAARDKRPALLLVPAALILGYLSHASNAFAVIAFLVIFAPVLLRRRYIPTLAAGSALAAAIFLPWLYWTHFVQPYGTALLRFAVGREFGFDHRAKPLLDSAVEALRDLGAQGWLRSKGESFTLLTDVTGRVAEMHPPYEAANHSFAGNQRTLDFIVTLRTIGFAAFGLIGIVVFGLIGRWKSVDGTARMAAACGLLGIISTVLGILPLGVMHVQAYASILLLIVAGALAIAQIRSPAMVGLFALWLVYFIPIWIIDPLRNADHLDIMTVAQGFLAVAAMGAAIFAKQSAAGSTGSSTATIAPAYPMSSTLHQYPPSRMRVAETQGIPEIPRRRRPLSLF